MRTDRTFPLTARIRSESLPARPIWPLAERVSGQGADVTTRTTCGGGSACSGASQPGCHLFVGLLSGGQPRRDCVSVSNALEVEVLVPDTRVGQRLLVDPGRSTQDVV